MNKAVLIFYENGDLNKIIFKATVSKSSTETLGNLFSRNNNNKKININNVQMKKGGGKFNLDKKIKTIKFEDGKCFINVLFEEEDEIMIDYGENEYSYLKSNVLKEKMLKQQKEINYNIDNNEGIFGFDGRIPVGKDILKEEKYNKIFRLEILFSDSDKSCGTGFLITNNVMLTAGHCLYDFEKGLGFANYIELFTNENIYKGNKIKEIVVLEKYCTTGLKEYDIGIILFEDSFNYVDEFYKLEVDNNLVLENKIIAGYPFDKELTFQHCIGTINNQNKIYTYKISTNGGQSGSPIFDNENKCYGIHIRNGNYGIRFNENIIEFINKFISF